MTMTKTKKIPALVALCLLTCHLALSRPAAAADAAEIGMWTGAGACSLLYTPVKAVVFLLMGIGGGLSMIGTVPFDQTEISQDIIKWGFYGDWLIRPDHLTGDDYPHILGFDEEIHFITDSGTLPIQ